MPADTEATERLAAVWAGFQIKKVAAADSDERTFQGLASTWDHDLGDDIIHQGAFKETLADWRKSGRVVPLLDTHDSFSVFSAVGKMTDAKETKDGLLATFKVVEGEDGDKILTRLREGIVNRLSIGYRPIKFEFEDSDEARFGTIRHLHKVELHEVSLVMRPMNPFAAIDTGSVKAMLAQEELTATQIQMLTDLQREIGERIAQTTKTGAPAPEEDPAKADPPAEEGDPDTSRLDLLRLRRLGYHPVAREA